MAQFNTKIKWNNANFFWNDNGFTWSDVELIEEITRGDTSSTGIKKKVDKLEPKKKKRLIHLIMRKKGIKIYDGSKVVKEDIKIDIEDVEMIIKEIKAKLKAENIHV
tara:strand:+ start:493 stop:813 length:321 start_codon:yes stop_codon:yes gene_type:complete